MTTKVFVLGRPGSGKSTAARYLKQMVQETGRQHQHFNDYDILRAMFLADIHHEKFQPTEHNGFNATDLSVLDDALIELEQQVRLTSTTADLVTIEFARDDYRQALSLFSPDFLKDAFILFIHANLETCISRVHERVERARSHDDHPSFSDDIFRRYYSKSNREYMLHHCQQEFDLEQPVTVINNMGPLECFTHSLDRFLATVFQAEKKLLIPA